MENMSCGGSSAVVFDMVVAGSCMTDLVSQTPRLPIARETIHGHMLYSYGGKGVNQCIQAGCLETRTAMVCQVGTDYFGDIYIQNYKNNGVATDSLSGSYDCFTATALSFSPSLSLRPGHTSSFSRRQQEEHIFCLRIALQFEVVT
ncbi:ribokinase-like [Acipenser ruthenus]|uniref:ribokinase-like n=1 Tax=Acipenser ruthenus TaxID=7906 RepID=UPI002740AB33|nr:ribokinase-like [Acipenser ruthenus]